jgi:hypothetical protein
MRKSSKVIWIFVYIGSIFIFSIFGFTVGYFSSPNESNSLLTVSWGDGKYGKAFYGAQVFAYPEAGKYRVEARVTIGQGNPYYHDIGVLGRVATWLEARDKYGTITWTPAGLNIGSSNRVEYYLPRAKLENHR